MLSVPLCGAPKSFTQTYITLIAPSPYFPLIWTASTSSVFNGVFFTRPIPMLTNAQLYLSGTLISMNVTSNPNCLSLQPGKTVTTALNVRKTLVLNLLSHWESTLCSLSTEFTQPCDDKSLDQKRAISFCAGVLFVCCLSPKELSQFISHIWPLRTMWAISRYTMGIHLGSTMFALFVSQLWEVKPKK